MIHPTTPKAVISAVSRARLGDVQSAISAQAGRRNNVWFVDTEQGAFVVRLLASSERLPMELAVIEQAAEAGIPVSPIVWSDTETPIMVQRVIRGQRLAEAEPSDRLLHSVAATLRSIHLLSVEQGSGNLRSDLTGASASLADWFVAPVLAEQSAVLNVRSADLARINQALRHLESRRALLNAQPVVLVHGDYSPDNILVRDHQVVGVIDWEAAKAGPPALDFGWWDWYGAVFGTPWSGDDLVEAYGPSDRGVTDELRHLVQLRIWTRELLAGLKREDRPRAEAARRGLTTMIDR